MNQRLIRLAIGTLVGLLIAAGIVWWQVSSLPGGSAGGTQTGTALIGGPFSLTDSTGKPVTQADYQGRYTLIYFGFTFCPDVCPTELQVMATALDRLGAKADQVQPLFVTVDPERDTVTQMAEYVAQFHPRLIGLTGTPDQIAQAARAYRVYYAKAPGKDGDGYYTMDHSSFVYLMGPDGRFLEAFAHGTTPERMAETIGSHMRS
ncbi:electron transporter SenC [Skermanella stibiiresistens SB22]|uniref:Electron transporter SenC n=1 Tax=Skermanella stibiiresistens SB22 TaxID=1385369 RepID=W9HC09_9PROT|nr:SCO family protein [Skermanella stibiiresistens]EWY41423.1 electron transporter SenC [Skermanella stibiiresistens SB22]